MTKHTLRKAMRSRLRLHPGESAPLRETLRAWIQDHPDCHTIAAFAALPGEPDLLPLISDLSDRRWVLPRVQGELLTFHEIKDPFMELVSGAFGIREPQDGTPSVEVADIDLFLCPGLAFDRQGNRLGRGRGFYDRILSQSRPDAIKLGVCFPEQIVPDTCAEPHDIRMDAVIKTP